MKKPSLKSLNNSVQIARILLLALFLICDFPNDRVSAIAIFIFLILCNPLPLFSGFTSSRILDLRVYTRIPVSCILLPLR